MARYWGGLLLGWILGGIVFISFIKWFLDNLRDTRYVIAISFGALGLVVFFVKKKLIPPMLINYFPPHGFFQTSPAIDYTIPGRIFARSTIATILPGG